MSPHEGHAESCLLTSHSKHNFICQATSESQSPNLFQATSRQPNLFVIETERKSKLELKQIQGFPEDYKLSGDIGKQIKQIGNAVPPPLIEMIISSLKIHSKA